MKIKLNKAGNYTIKGLNAVHLEVLQTLILHVNLGNEGYPYAAFELANLFEKYGGVSECECDVKPHKGITLS